MCRDGARLYGRSKVCSGVKPIDQNPSTVGGGFAIWSGNSRKHAVAMVMTSARRFTCVDSSRRPVQRKNDATKNRSIDQYGTIIAGMNGVYRSHANAMLGTGARAAVMRRQPP